MKNYVLGTGIAGLITAYLTGLPVIGKDIGGQENHSFPLGPRILESTSETDLLLERLDIKGSKKTYNIGYREFGILTDTPSEDFRDNYFYKTRGRHRATESSMSGGRKQIVGYDLHSLHLTSRLIDALKEKGQIIQAEILDLNQLALVTSIGNLSYDQLISTIPLKILNILLGDPMNKLYFETRDTHFYLVTLKDPYRILGNFDYIYNLDYTVVHRISRSGLIQYPDDELFVLESHDKYLEQSENFKILDHVVVPGCQIVNNLDLDHLCSIKLNGRYGRWTQHHKIEDSIREAMKYAQQMGT